MRPHQLIAQLAQAKADDDTALVERLRPLIDARIPKCTDYPPTDAAGRARDAAALLELERDYPALFGARP